MVDAIDTSNFILYAIESNRLLRLTHRPLAIFHAEKSPEKFSNEIDEQIFNGFSVGVCVRALSTK